MCNQFKLKRTLTVGIAVLTALLGLIADRSFARTRPRTSIANLAPSQRLTATEIAAGIDEYLRPFQQTNNFSGVVLVSQNDRAVYQKGYGQADPSFDVLNTPQTQFHIASISKGFTAAAILMLEERGQLDTTDPVSKFLPDYPNGTRIRLEHLLRHTSGIPNVDDYPEVSVPYTPYTPETIVARFEDKPLDFEPGSRARYSNSNYALLALIIEKVSGLSYGEFLKTNIFDVLGLKSTTHYGDARRIIRNLAVGTEPDGLSDLRYVPFLGWSSTTGSGSIVSTAADLCKFTRSVFSGSLLKRASVAKLIRAEGVFPYGWSHRELFGHKGMGNGGRMRGFISDIEYFPDDDMCVAILTNSYSSVGQVIARDIGAIALGQTATPPKIGYVRPQPGQLAGFAGHFQMPENYFTPNASMMIRDHGDYLEASWSSGGTSVIYPTGGDDFVDRSNWAMVHFTRDAQNQITGFTYNLLQKFAARKLLASTPNASRPKGRALKEGVTSGMP